MYIAVTGNKNNKDVYNSSMVMMKKFLTPFTTKKFLLLPEIWMRHWLLHTHRNINPISKKSVTPNRACRKNQNNPMRFVKNTANGYVPSYTRTEITDSLHKTFHHVFSAYQIFFITAFLHSLFLPDVPPRYRFHDGSFPRSSSQSGWKSHALPSRAYQLHMS